MESEEEVAASVVEEEVALLSNLDLFMISLLLGFFVYWFFYRKDEKPNDEPFKKLQVVTSSNITRSESFSQSIADRMRSSGRNVCVFYGSQTGTAEEFSNRLGKDAQRFGMKALVMDPEELGDLDDLPEITTVENHLAIFCMATYGEGDPTDNAQDFHDWLQRGETRLDGLRYAVFGLGNKTYEHYNSVGKYFDKRLEELGAERVYPLGLGDDDTNIEEDFVTWKDGFWPSVCEQLGIDATAIQGKSFRSYSHRELDDVKDNKVYKGEVARLNSYNNQRPPYDAKNPYLSPIKVNRELHQGGGRSCMHIELDITGSRIRYDAGDHVAIYPMNDVTMVADIGKRLNLDLDKIFTLDNLDEDSSKRHPFPCPTSYRTALTYYLDLTSPLRTNVLHELAEYCGEGGDKELLLKMSSNTEEGKKLYTDWVVDARRTFLQILTEIKSCQPPIDHVCELLPKLQARYYSIASSPRKHPTSIHVCAVVTEYKSLAGYQNYGVCTNWLRTKIPHTADDELQCPRVPIFVRKSQFRLPFKVTHPVLMIGPGTGVAPFIGFIQDRQHHRENGKDVGRTILYFGCRKKDQDYIYQNELQAWEQDGVLSELNVAFSREDPNEKVYVQNLLLKNKDSVWDVISNNGHIFVCGDARYMARDVQKAIVDICKECGKMETEEKAMNFVKTLMNKGRYSCDVWS